MRKRYISNKWRVYKQVSKTLMGKPYPHQQLLGRGLSCSLKDYSSNNTVNWNILQACPSFSPHSESVSLVLIRASVSKCMFIFTHFLKFCPFQLLFQASESSRNRDMPVYQATFPLIPCQVNRAIFHEGLLYFLLINPN